MGRAGGHGLTVDGDLDDPAPGSPAAGFDHRGMLAAVWLLGCGAPVARLAGHGPNGFAAALVIGVLSAGRSGRFMRVS